MLFINFRDKEPKLTSTYWQGWEFTTIWKPLDFKIKYTIDQISNKWATQVALMVKNPSVNAGNIKRCEFSLWVGKIPWRRAWQPTSVFLPGESPWTESVWLQSIGAQRVGHGWSNLARTGLNFLRKDGAEVGLERKAERKSTLWEGKVNCQEKSQYPGSRRVQSGHYGFSRREYSKKTHFLLSLRLKKSWSGSKTDPIWPWNLF